MYKKIDEADKAFLRGVIPPERLYFGNDINPDYSHDELGGTTGVPDALAEVVSAVEVSGIMRYANEHNIPVVARGQGTGLVGGCVPLYGGIVVSLIKMNRILELDAENLILTVEPGVPLMEISAFVEARGLFYPPDPGEKSATIGGNISTNAGGMRAVKYGVTRDFVRGLEVVLPTGEIVNFGGKVVKNASGYSLKDMIIGSEGTLGIITKAMLKLLPLPKTSVSLLIPFDTVINAIGAVPALMRTPVIPTAVEFMEREVILDAETYLGKKFPDKSADAYLLMTYDGLSRQDIERVYPTVADICFPLGGKDLLIVDTEERKDSVWSARGAFLEAIKSSTDEMDECDVVVPKNKVALVVEYLGELRKKHAVRVKCFGHAGDGNLHVYVLRDGLAKDIWQKKLRAVFDDLYGYAFGLGGKVSGEHGIGFAKKPYLEMEEPDIVRGLMKKIKLAFDPNMVLNPGKVVE